MEYLSNDSISNVFIVVSLSGQLYRITRIRITGRYRKIAVIIQWDTAASTRCMTRLAWAPEFAMQTCGNEQLVLMQSVVLNVI